MCDFVYNAHRERERENIQNIKGNCTFGVLLAGTICFLFSTWLAYRYASTLNLAVSNAAKSITVNNAMISPIGTSLRHVSRCQARFTCFTLSVLPLLLASPCCTNCRSVSQRLALALSFASPGAFGLKRRRAVTANHG